MDGNSNASEQTDEPNLFRPDTVITPDNAAPRSASQPQSVAPAPVDPTAPMPAATVPTPMPPLSTQPGPAQRPYYNAATAQDDPSAITWTASEYIAHQKSAGWYALLALAALAAAVAVWFLTKDVIATATVVVGLFLLGAYAGRKPHEETYTLDEYGLTIGNRRYAYGEFRSFSVVPEGAFLSIELSPLKRFAMYTTIYFDPADQDRILDVFAYHLPMEEARNNLADSLMRRIHF